ncbi:MAG: 1-acyl-sn-glycerol-3-phosphate acyltransferase, partial [Rubrivivax sp.]|nr:1-acyl-sn-glycerol-3-phosphate acyltransferase [Rubrivivax sp.]
MRHLVAAARLARASLHVLHGLWIMRRFPHLNAAERQAHIGRWSAALLRHVGLSLHVSGTPRPGATLVVANHVSFIDIAAIHAAAPQVRFVSKADVLSWPVLGALIRNAGTLFIERERKRDALRVVHSIAAALEAGDTIGVFPEGTTGLGRELLPFHANLLQAAIATGTPVQPVLLRYDDADGPFSAVPTWLGETTLLQAIWRVASAPRLAVHVSLLSPQGTRHADRRALAAALQQQMQDELLRAV